MTLGEALEAAIREAVSDVLREVFAEQLKAQQRQPDEMLNPQAAAEVAGVSVATIRRWISSGALRRYGKGRVVRVRRADVLALSPDEGRRGATVAQLLGRK